MTYTVIYVDDSKIDFTEEIKKLFEDCKAIKTFNAEDKDMNSLIAFVNEGDFLNNKYKKLENDFLRVKMYEIPGETNLLDFVSDSFEQSRMREHYGTLSWSE